MLTVSDFQILIKSCSFESRNDPSLISEVVHETKFSLKIFSSTHVCLGPLTLNRIWFSPSATDFPHVSVADVNECFTHHDCSHICVNNEGSYHCECESGYELSEEGRTCRGNALCHISRLNDSLLTISVQFHRKQTKSKMRLSSNSDINECHLHNGRCSHRCMNVEGSYYCHCPLGHVLSENTVTCEGMIQRSIEHQNYKRTNVVGCTFIPLNCKFMT